MAVPNPEVELTRLGKLLAKGLPPVLVVTGVNDSFRAEAMDLVLAAMPKDGELRIVDAVGERAGGGAADDDEADDDGDEAGDAADAAAGLAACPELLDLRGGGLFAKRAFVVVRRAANWWRKHATTVGSQLPHIGKGCGLVIEAGKLDKRKKAAATLVKQLADGGALFEFRELYDTPFDRTRSPLEGELCKWVIGRAAKAGVPLQPEAAWLLVAQVGKNPPDLLAELQRLRDRFGDGVKAPLAPAQLQGKLTTSFASTPFELADAVLGGDRRAAFRSVRAMFDRGVRQKDGRTMDAGGLLPFATSWLFQRLAQVLEGRQMLEGGVSLRDVPERLGVRFQGEQLAAQVQRWTKARLSRGLLALHACQRSSRTTGEDPDVLLERFLCQWFDGVPIPTAEDFEL
ncbi:MAG: hypothetical protein JNL12_15295 [Planctomycetes bacterium]|nr:hypothetical protein [Planctomycetota bacterium]